VLPPNGSWMVKRPARGSAGVNRWDRVRRMLLAATMS